MYRREENQLVVRGIQKKYMEVYSTALTLTKPQIWDIYVICVGRDDLYRTLHAANLGVKDAEVQRPVYVGR